MPVKIPELDPDPKWETPNEWTTVELPLLQQLVAMGWEYLEGNLDYPQKIELLSFWAPKKAL